ncbi:enkurin [Nilaparvata lugens]|uniref:enkurin n=1 Tax=Nilaparvata lugens TaxID=108931 RepID=UPI00193E6ED8|nr:enkurin [Nilaparvata lugens]
MGPRTRITPIEDIRALIPPSPEQVPSTVVYRSKHACAVRQEADVRRSCHKTMGFAQVELPAPDRFLRKRSRVVRRPHVDKQPMPLDARKPPLPPRYSDYRSYHCQKNFKRQNIVDAVRAHPKEPEPALADTTNGDVKKLANSGLMPQYIYSKNFGKVPKYLTMRQQLVNETIKQIKKEEAKKKPLLKYVTEEERVTLLDGLKKNWEELQKEFQLLPMVTDTVPKIKRKTQLEKKLKDLEKDIDLLERNPIIYIDERNRNNY